MAKSGCDTCRFRVRYDNNPQSLLGRLWRWHANWCPGWKAYMTSLPDDERKRLAGKYGLLKFNY
uniref:Uncharacterized protein n=1 Tax=Desulfobacca acetoxidans TaxID=60893 RepID=A0A7V6A4Y3_9BACT